MWYILNVIENQSSAVLDYQVVKTCIHKSLLYYGIFFYVYSINLHFSIIFTFFVNFLFAF